MEGFFWLEAPSHPPGNSSLASFFPLKHLAFAPPPPPSRFPMTFLLVGMDISGTAHCEYVVCKVQVCMG